MSNYKICTNCVMDTSDSRIYFDSNGVCDHCNTFKNSSKPLHEQAKLKAHIEQKISSQTCLTVKLLAPGDKLTETPGKERQVADCAFRCIYYAVYGRNVEYPELGDEKEKAYNNISKSKNPLIKQLWKKYIED